LKLNDEHYVPFIAYIMGSYFGDVDVFRDEIRNERDSTAKADQECDFLVISKEDCKDIKNKFHEEFKEMQKLAEERQIRHYELIEALQEKVK
jgi:predicted nuclease with TOPRIM domain